MDTKDSQSSPASPSATAEIPLLSDSGNCCSYVSNDGHGKAGENDRNQETAMCNNNDEDKGEKNGGGQDCPVLDNLSGLAGASNAPEGDITYDGLLTLLGEFGRFQQRACFLLYLIYVTGAMQVLVTVFSMAVPDHRCSLAGVENDTWLVQSVGHADLINASIPLGAVSGGARQYSKCRRYSASSVEPSYPNVSHYSVKRDYGMPFTDNSSWSDGSNNTAVAGLTEACSSFVYDQSLYTSTIVTELDLVCDRKTYRSHVQMMVMLGNLLGSLLTGLASDMWGRKIILMMAGVVHLAASFAIPLLRNYVLLVFTNLLLGMSVGGLLGPAFVLCMELVGPSKRLWPGYGVMAFWSFGMIALAPLAYWLRDWTHLHLAAASIGIPIIGLSWLVPESPRWLLSKKRLSEAEKIVARAARVNKVTLPPGLLEKVRVTAGENAGGGMSVWRHCFSVRLVMRHCIIFVTWFATSLTYYGLSWNVGTLGGSVYVNMVLSGVAELVAFVFCILLLDRIGRRTLCCGQLVLAGVMCTATILPVSFAPQSMQWMTVALAMMGKLGIAGAFATIYIFASELFPTLLRNSGIGTSSFCARVGGILAPYIANLGDHLQGNASIAVPLVIMGTASIAVGILQLFLPETLGRRLPETIEDAANMGRKARPDKTCVTVAKA